MDWHALNEIIKIYVYPVIWFSLGVAYNKYVQRKNKGSIGKMPIAVVVNSISDQIPLKSLTGGYVVVRRMNYGESLARSSKATKLLMSNTGQSKDFQGEIDIQTEAIALWDFANLVVEHNLTDASEQLLNFKNVAHVKGLPSSVGEEIGQIIDNFNTPEETEDSKN